ncbi:hypothetical protein [Streptomyces sp. NPDC017964]|uniref:hypothetical protein n=1 Tax=Streptomyces sp. NPDC017964 TaxID=3365022 RepID=UPI0037B7F201
MVTPGAEYDRAPSRNRVAAGILFFGDQDRVMLVDPIYKETGRSTGASPLRLVGAGQRSAAA